MERHLAAVPPGLIPAHAGSTQLLQSFQRRAGAHPRSRGEHFAGAELLGGRSGSSPLTRGARGWTCVVGVVRRLIPAHAGSTPPRYRSRGRRWAHPRSRGEHSRPARPGWSWMGSSPLTRGAPPAKQSIYVSAGLIPAHAGSTGCSEGWCDGGKAHPRSRGEHQLGAKYLCVGVGSSPLTRGARQCTEAYSREYRLIPAHAGSTTARGRAHTSTGAHPRSRGEHLSSLPSSTA